MLTVLAAIFVFGVLVTVHEFGHFIWAKKFGVHIYEFSIGMGPAIFTHEVASVTNELLYYEFFLFD